MRKSVSLSRALLAAVLLQQALPSPVRSAELGVEEILFGDLPMVSIASGRQERQERAASNVTVITAQQIKERGYRDIKDVVKGVAGYEIAYDRDEWVFQARGVSADVSRQFLVLIDGRNMDLVYRHWAGQLIDQPMDLSNVKQIEIVKGPGSVTWGAGGLAGVVNIVTYSPRDMADAKRKNRVSTAYGSQRTSKSNVLFSSVQPDGKSGVVMNGTWMKSDGKDSSVDASTNFALFDTPGFSSAPLGRYTTAVDRFHPSYRLHLRGASGDLFYSGFLYYSDEFNRQFEANQGRDVRMAREQYFVEGGWEKKVGETNVKAKLSIGGGRQEYETIDADLVSGKTAPQTNGNQSRDLLASLALQRAFFDDALDLSFGSSAHNKFGQQKIVISTRTVDEGNSGNGFFFRSEKDESLGVYALATYHINPKLDLSLGTRYDMLRSGDILAAGPDSRVFTPRAGIIWEVTPASYLKFLFNSGYQPSHADKPEKIHQYEVVYLKRMEKSNLNVVAYLQRMYDSTFLNQTGGITGTTPNSVNTSVVVGEELSKGIEFGWDAQVGKHTAWFSGDVREAVQRKFTPTSTPDSRRIDTNNDKLGYPNVTFNTGATLRLASSFFVAPSVRWRGPMNIRMTPTPTAVTDAVYERTSPQTYVDLNVGYDVNSALSVSVNSNNVTNNRRGLPHSVRNGIYVPYGRYLEGRVNFSF